MDIRRRGHCADEAPQKVEAQTELAKKVGTTQSVIARLEDAEYTGYSLTMLERIAAVCGVALKLHAAKKPNFDREVALIQAAEAAPAYRLPSCEKKVRSNLGPTTAKLGPKPCTMTQNKARRTNKIDFLQLPWAQEVSGSNPDAPTTNSLN